MPLIDLQEESALPVGILCGLYEGKREAARLDVGRSRASGILRASLAMRVLLLLTRMVVAGCLAPAPTCSRDCASSEPEATGFDVTVGVLAILVRCPPGSTCAGNYPSPVPHAEVFLDGEFANVTNGAGKATIHGVGPGDHTLCARRTDLGNATIAWSKDQQLGTNPDGTNFELMLYADAAACPA